MAASGPPTIAITLGDVCGIGPEIVAKALASDELVGLFTPLVIGSSQALTNAIEMTNVSLEVQQVLSPGDADAAPGLVSVFDPHDLDLGSVTEPLSTSTRRPTITIYEKVPAGLGFAERLYELHGTLLDAAREVVSQCPCAYGCPACIGPVLDPEQEAKPLTLAIIEAAS